MKGHVLSYNRLVTECYLPFLSLSGHENCSLKLFEGIFHIVLQGYCTMNIVFNYCLFSFRQRMEEEKQRELEREKDREREREREKDREMALQRERQRVLEREAEKQRERDRLSGRDRDRLPSRDRDRLPSRDDIGKEAQENSLCKFILFRIKMKWH